MRFCSFSVVFLGLLLLQLGQIPAMGQSLTSGDIAGTITDPSGAVIPNATVTLTSSESGATQTRTTNAQGAYRFALLVPGSYKVAVAAPGFQQTQKATAVAVGQAAILNFSLAVGTAGSTTVEVSAGAEVVQART
jgi:hypothetical protein